MNRVGLMYNLYMRRALNFQLFTVRKKDQHRKSGIPRVP